MRAFDSGATRDADTDKLAYEGFLSPAVLERYARFMHKHRVQSDGNLRDADNWQKGMPTPVYQDSLVRHTVQAWGRWRGEEVLDERGEPVDLEEALCAILFNASGLLFELLRDSPASSPTCSCGTPSPS